MMKQNCFYKTHQSYQCSYVEQFLEVKLFFLLEIELGTNIVLFLTTPKLNEVLEEYLLKDHYEG
jgi:hypothetical protein